MEFAVEAQKLLEISLEGSVGNLYLKYNIHYNKSAFKIRDIYWSEYQRSTKCRK